MAALCDTSPAFALIDAVPTLSALTTPCEFTTATAVLLVDHTIPVVDEVPLLFVALAVSCCVAPTRMVAVAGAMLTAVTVGIGLTISPLLQLIAATARALAK